MPVKNCEGSETSFLQANKLACHSFTDAGRRQIPGSKTKDFVTHGTAGSMIFMFALVVLALHPKSRGDNAEAGPDGCCTQCDCAIAEET